MNLTPGRIFEGGLGRKKFPDWQRTGCAGVISAGGFLAVAVVSQGPSKAEPWWPGNAGCRQAVRQPAGQPIGASGCHRALLPGGQMKPSTSWELMSGFLLAALPSGSSSHSE